jgi:hypothetical protein
MLFVVCVIWLPSSGEDEQLRQCFLTEAPAGWQRIEDWESQLECEGSLANVVFKLPGSAEEQRRPQTENTLHWRQNKDRLLLKVTSPHENAQVFGVNARYSFFLTSANKASGGEAQWRVRALEDTAPPAISPLAGREQPDSSIRGNIDSRFGWYLFPATRYGEFGKWRDAITQKGVTLTKVEVSPNGANQHVKVHCVWRFKDHRGKNYTHDVTLVFDPSNNWALTESVSRGSDSSTHRKVFYRSGL